MRYDLVRPCANCPFRTDGPGYLRAERAKEIAIAVAQGAEFACHKTTVIDPDNESENMATDTSQMCAGAMIAMYRENAPNQIMRIGERLGVFDPDRLDMTAPVGTLNDMIHRHNEDADHDTEPCSVADYECVAPAGYLMGGSVIAAIEREETYTCVLCGEPVCHACSVPFEDRRACNWHEDET